jgi:hypothetical protein
VRYQDVLEHQANLSKVLRVPRLLEWLWGLLEPATREDLHRDPHGVFADNEGYVYKIRPMQPQVKHLVLSAVDHGIPYWVAPEISEVIEHTGPDYPDMGRIYREMFPTPQGFLMYDKPLKLPPRMSKSGGGGWIEEEVPAIGFMWDTGVVVGRGDGKEETHIALTLLADWRTENMRAWKEGYRVPQTKDVPFSPLGMVTFLSGDPVGRLLDMPAVAARDASDLKRYDDPAKSEGGLHPQNHYRFELQILYAATAITFMSQKIAAPTARSVDRPTRRRLLKEGWHNPHTVNVVELRRLIRSPSSEEHDPIDWDHRWWVRSHWRSQFYPSLNQHRMIIVPAHTKGPEDKPLAPPKTNVFVVTR